MPAVCDLITANGQVRLYPNPVKEGSWILSVRAENSSCTVEMSRECAALLSEQFLSVALEDD